MPISVSRRWCSWFLKALLIIIIAGLVIATRIFHWDSQALLWWQEYNTDAETRKASVWLPDYRLVRELDVQLERKDELSGLSWKADTQTLLATTGGTARLLELDTQGRVLRRIELRGFADAEAVEVLDEGRIGILDERRRELAIFPLTAETQVLERSAAQILDLGFSESANKGFEGLGWIASERRLLLAKERDSIGLFQLQLPVQGTAPVLEERVAPHQLIVRDLSSVTYDARTGHVLLLSDESHTLLELDRQGQPRSFIRLISGFNGLTHRIAQAEGVTLDAEGRLYIVGEPNRLYVFEPQPKP